MSELAADDYPGFLVEIKARIRQAQYKALRAVNSELVQLCYQYGTRPKLQSLVREISWAKNLVNIKALL